MTILFGVEDDKPKPIYARSGWEIPQPKLSEVEAERQLLDLVRIRTTALIDDMAKKGKTSLKIRSVSSYLYNCVGMVFSNRRAWIDISIFMIFLEKMDIMRFP